MQLEVFLVASYTGPSDAHLWIKLSSIIYENNKGSVFAQESDTTIDGENIMTKKQPHKPFNKMSKEGALTAYQS